MDKAGGDSAVDCDFDRDRDDKNSRAVPAASGILVYGERRKDGFCDVLLPAVSDSAWTRGLKVCNQVKEIWAAVLIHEENFWKPPRFRRERFCCRGWMRSVFTNSHFESPRSQRRNQARNAATTLCTFKFPRLRSRRNELFLPLRTTGSSPVPCCA